MTILMVGSWNIMIYIHKVINCTVNYFMLITLHIYRNADILYSPAYVFEPKLVLYNCTILSQLLNNKH